MFLSGRSPTKRLIDFHRCQSTADDSSKREGRSTSFKPEFIRITRIKGIRNISSQIQL